MKVKCEVGYNIVQQCLDIFIFDDKNWYIYKGPEEIEVKPRSRNTIQTNIEFLKIPYEFCDVLEEGIARKYATRRGMDISIFENTSKDSHIKDLKWILTHFINKDKRED